jgi:hypothetical protein
VITWVSYGTTSIPAVGNKIYTSLLLYVRRCWAPTTYLTFAVRLRNIVTSLVSSQYYDQSQSSPTLPARDFSNCSSNYLWYFDLSRCYGVPICCNESGNRAVASIVPDRLPHCCLPAPDGRETPGAIDILFGKGTCSVSAFTSKNQAAVLKIGLQ